MIQSRYTPACDAVILSNVQNNPSNLLVAFEVSANRLNRTPKAISLRYYQKIKPNTEAIAVASNTGVISLGKNSIRRQVSGTSTLREAMLYAGVRSMTKEEAITFMLSAMSTQAKNLLLRKLIN
jgi:hypothetical protein